MLKRPITTPIQPNSTSSKSGVAPGIKERNVPSSSAGARDCSAVSAHSAEKDYTDGVCRVELRPNKPENVHDRPSLVGKNAWQSSVALLMSGIELTLGIARIVAGL